MSDRSRTRTRASAGLLTAAGVLATIVLTGSPAAAAESTSTTITSQGPIDIAFGADWVVEVVVSGNGFYDEKSTGPVDTTGGTIDAFIVGMAEPFADDVPLQAGGRAYISQPDSQTLLGAGAHELTAVFTPAPGSNLDPSQSRSSITINVGPLAIEPSFTVESGADELVTSVELSVGGAYVDARQSAPPGMWNVDVTDAGGTSVFSSEVAQPTGEPEMLTVPVDVELDPGADYSVAATFTPDPSIAGGVTVAEMPQQTFTTPGSTFTDIATAPVPVPMTLSIVGLVVVVLLLIAAIVVPILLRRRRGRPAPPAATA
ncbi:hypothetical protein ACFSBZ_06710 [Amnibacterium flavum]|uniref:DUF4397 domain-containing protein n=1 Tax=Amnibacterium flavum TaxID=2173173 RepID=A0A2V1HQG3_9MICO|nr:hypothetical protein [Amnibacterium flavum]PVZ93862.1 hypothetical protein DDQ50_08765 [Amnibacterium flavum]